MELKLARSEKRMPEGWGAARCDSGESCRASRELTRFITWRYSPWWERNKKRLTSLGRDRGDG